MTDSCHGQRERRTRIAHLIKLGELVESSGVVELVDEDRTTLLGAFLELADRLRGLADVGVDPGHLVDHWRRRALKAFNAGRNAVPITAKADGAHVEGSSGPTIPPAAENIQGTDPLLRKDDERLVSVPPPKSADAASRSCLLAPAAPKLLKVLSGGNPTEVIRPKLGKR